MARNLEKERWTALQPTANAAGHTDLQSTVHIFSWCQAAPIQAKTLQPAHQLQLTSSYWDILVCCLRRFLCSLVKMMLQRVPQLVGRHRLSQGILVV
jgi:hypothetical protein